MRELTMQEMEEVGGGYGLDDIVTLSTQTGFVGSVLGYAVTGTVAGATTWGWWGAGIGFAAGAGWGAGNWAYNTFIYDGY